MSSDWLLPSRLCNLFLRWFTNYRPPSGWASQVYTRRVTRWKKNAASVIPFRCIDCAGQPTAPRGQKRPMPTSTQEAKKPDTFDVSSLLRTLRHKDSWRCTCKKSMQPARKMRAKSAIEGKSHDPKCMLTRTSCGEKRWDGKNMGITLEQLQYSADRNLY